MSRAGWGPLVVAIACFAGVVWAELRTRPPRDRPTAVAPSPDAARLLGDLRPGDKVAGWTVDSISMPAPRQLRVDLSHREVRFSITVTPLGELSQSPALQTERFAIYYGHARPEGTTLPRGGLRAVLHQLQRRVEASEGDADVRSALEE